MTRPELPGIGHEFVEANGLRFSVATCGAGDKLALCLHGFPECWYSWRHQMPLLAKHGYRVWAPDLRGYGETSRPAAVSDYAVEHLMDDVAGLIDASGARETMLVAHDWGGIVAWWFAMHGARPLERLVCMNIPHPGAARAQAGWRQRLRSWYAIFFQIKGLPERMLSEKRLARMFERTSRPGSFTAEDLAVYGASAMQPGARTAMVNYYRALVRGGGMKRMIERGSPPIEIPTLLLWGTEDIALRVELTHGMAPFVRDLTLRYLPGVGHWVQQEAPEDVNRMLDAWLAGDAVPTLPGDESFREPAR